MHAGGATRYRLDLTTSCIVNFSCVFSFRHTQIRVLFSIFSGNPTAQYVVKYVINLDTHLCTIQPHKPLNSLWMWIGTQELVWNPTYAAVLFYQQNSFVFLWGTLFTMLQRRRCWIKASSKRNMQVCLPRTLKIS